MKKQKMNKMVEICMQDKAFRESYEKKVDVLRKVTVPLPEKVDTFKDAEIEMFMEWFSNQRFPEEN
jgi:ribosomal protein S17